MIVVVLFWLTAFYLVQKNTSKPMFYALVVSLAFGSFAVIPTDITAGLTVTPTSVFAIMLISKVLLKKEGVRFFCYMLRSYQRLKLLFLFWVVALFTTIFMTRIFAGEIYIYTVRDPGLDLLSVTAQNFSQFSYMTLSTVTTFACALLFLRKTSELTFLYALLGLGGALVFTGLLDLAGMDMILEPFRNSSYAIADNQMLVGSRRVIGLMPEPSVFGSTCLSVVALLLFFSGSISSKKTKKLIFINVALLMVFVWMSASSTAFIGVLCLVSVMGFRLWLLQFNKFRIEEAQNKIMLLIIASIFSVIVFTYLMAFTSVYESVLPVLDKMLLSKTDSSSFNERSEWTRVSWRAFLESRFVGVGVGSTRASSLIVAIFAATGVIGATLLLSQICVLCIRRNTDSIFCKRVLGGCTSALMVILIMKSVTATNADVGILISIVFGFMAAVKVGDRDRWSGQKNQRRRTYAIS